MLLGVEHGDLAGALARALARAARRRPGHRPRRPHDPRGRPPARHPGRHRQDAHDAGPSNSSEEHSHDAPGTRPPDAARPLRRPTRRHSTTPPPSSLERTCSPATSCRADRCRRGDDRRALDAALGRGRRSHRPAAAVTWSSGCCAALGVAPTATPDSSPRPRAAARVASARSSPWSPARSVAHARADDAGGRSSLLAPLVPLAAVAAAFAPAATPPARPARSPLSPAPASSLRRTVAVLATSLRRARLGTLAAARPRLDATPRGCCPRSRLSLGAPGAGDLVRVEAAAVALGLGWLAAICRLRSSSPAARPPRRRPRAFTAARPARRRRARRRRRWPSSSPGATASQRSEAPHDRATTVHVAGLRKRFGATVALDGVDLDVGTRRHRPARPERRRQDHAAAHPRDRAGARRRRRASPRPRPGVPPTAGSPIRRRLGYLPQEPGFHRSFTRLRLRRLRRDPQGVGRPPGAPRRGAPRARARRPRGGDAQAHPPAVGRHAPPGRHRPGAARRARPAGARRADRRPRPRAAAALPRAARHATAPGATVAAVDPPDRRRRRAVPARRRAARRRGPLRRHARRAGGARRRAACGWPTTATRARELAWVTAEGRVRHIGDPPAGAELVDAHRRGRLPAARRCRRPRRGRVSEPRSFARSGSWPASPWCSSRFSAEAARSGRSHCRLSSSWDSP